MTLPTVSAGSASVKRALCRLDASHKLTRARTESRSTSGGGVGEYVAGAPSRALQGSEWAGIQIDPPLNDLVDGGHALIRAAERCRIRVHVVVVDEESALALAAVDLLRASCSASTDSRTKGS